MISFHKAEAADRAWAHEILKRCAYPGAEYAFSCMYLWSDYFGELGRAGERLTQHAPWRGREVYLYPAGTGDLREAIEAIRADAAERGNPMRLRTSGRRDTRRGRDLAGLFCPSGTVKTASGKAVPRTHRGRQHAVCHVQMAFGCTYAGCLSGV